MLMPWKEAKISSCYKIIENLCWYQQSQKEYHMCIAREDVLFFCDVDSSRLCIVILSFPEFSPEFLTNEITFPLSNSKIVMELRKILLKV